MKSFYGGSVVNWMCHFRKQASIIIPADSREKREKWRPEGPRGAHNHKCYTCGLLTARMVRARFLSMGNNAAFFTFARISLWS